MSAQVCRWLLLSSLLCATLAGCGEQKSAAAATSGGTSSSVAGSTPEVLANVGDEKITLTDIRARVGDNLDQLESRYQQSRHKLIESALKEILRDRVLVDEAKKKGKSVEELVAAEAGGTIEPSDIEISAWYEENRARTGGRSLEQVRTQIADLLRTQRRRDAMAKLDSRLNSERKVAVYLEPYRVPLNNEGAPSMGPTNAPVTLVEFSDFDCPFCGRFHPTLKQLSEKYGDQLRIVYRQYPILSLHPNAFKAAEASLCANDQGKFWQMHDVMFQEQGRLSVKELKEKADRIGLGKKDFDQCLDSGRHTERVQEDMKEASRVGVTGTPALFVNGVFVEGGAVSLETVSRAIDQELARVKR
jgi:protein-disulfide isomerase/predicted transcriptional regulator